MFKRAFIILLVVGIVMGLGTYAYKLKADNLTAGMKAACMEKSLPMQQKGIISDLEGFCECSIKVRDQKTAEAIKDSGRACMDQYGKASLMKMCEDMNVDMKKEDATASGLNCECFYGNLTSFFGDEANARKGADNMTKAQRDEVVMKAFTSCKNKKE